MVRWRLITRSRSLARRRLFGFIGCAVFLVAGYVCFRARRRSNISRVIICRLTFLLCLSDRVRQFEGLVDDFCAVGPNPFGFGLANCFVGLGFVGDGFGRVFDGGFGFGYRVVDGTGVCRFILLGLRHGFIYRLGLGDSDLTLVDTRHGRVDSLTSRCRVAFGSRVTRWIMVVVTG